MNTTSSAFVLVCSLILTAPAMAQRQANPAQSRDAMENNWRFDYQKARQEAADAKKPMMVVLRCVP